MLTKIAERRIPEQAVAMFSFCFFLSSSPSSSSSSSLLSDEDDDDDRHSGHCNNDVCVKNPNQHDLYQLLHSPVKELKTGSIFLRLMASPTLNRPSSPAASSLSKHMTNSSSSSSLVTQGPSPIRPSPIREKYKFEEVCKLSYNVSTLNRIILLESVTKQTLALSSKSQAALETHLQELQPFRDVSSKFEQLNRRVQQLKNKLDVSKQKLEAVKNERTTYKTMFSDRRDEMEERVQLLRSMISRLNGKRSDLDQKKIELQKCRRQLNVKRAEFLQTISTLIYQIELPQSPSKTMVSNGRSRQCSISGYSLPDSTIMSPKHSFWGNSSSSSSLAGTPSRERREDIDDHSCIAIGYLAHLLLIISRLTDIPLKYDIEFCGSKSLIIDHLNNDVLNTFYVQSSWKTSDDVETDERKVRRNQGVKVTLYLKSKGSKDSRMYFKYGLYLVNQVVSQLNWTLDFVALRNNSSCFDVSIKNANLSQKIDISNTLLNVHQLINNYIKSYPCDPQEKCLLTGNEDRFNLFEDSIVYQEARMMLEANNAEFRKENSCSTGASSNINNHVHKTSTNQTPSTTTEQSEAAIE